MKVLGIDPGTQGALAVLDGAEVTLLDDCRCTCSGSPASAELGRSWTCTACARCSPSMARSVMPTSRRLDRSETRRRGRMALRHGLRRHPGHRVRTGHPVQSCATEGVAEARRLRGPAPDAARQRAMQLYSGSADRLARKRDAHRADALLLARFGAATAEAPDWWRETCNTVLQADAGDARRLRRLRTGGDWWVPPARRNSCANTADRYDSA